MDKKSKILFLVFFLVLAGSIFLTYYRYMVIRDYVIEAQVGCDPMTESCFVYVCDPENGEDCTGNLEQDTSYYKLLHRNAKNIPLCDPTEADCLVAVCLPGEADCQVTLCDPTSEEDVVCSDPEAYQMEHFLREGSDEDLMVFPEEEVSAPGMTEEGGAVTGGESDIASDSESE